MHGINGISGIMGFGWIFGILILVVLIWVAAKVLNPIQNPSQQDVQSPIDILKERFVKGEIDKDEYLEKKKHIE